jgi:hypothetical protein
MPTRSSGARRGRCGWSWTSLLSRSKALLDNKRIDIALQIGLQKDKALPDVPLIMDLTSDALKKAALRLIVSRQSIARPFAAPPGIPAERHVCYARPSRPP